MRSADTAGRWRLGAYASRAAECDFTRLSRPIELMPGYASSLEVLVKHWRPEQSINLLQGAYSGREDWQKLARPWRIAAGLAAAWAVFAFANEGVQSLKAGRELAAQEEQNLARY